MTEPRTEQAAGLAASDTGAPAARVFALYLPQFHPVPQNDAWWGRGFTEWTNVAKARPLFAGHVQPRLPADLGFYDLRVPEVREAQADLARQNGVEGFCYWHYWFGNGRRILERPFQEVLDSRRPDFPFSLAWANHSWTGIWSGLPDNVLLKQEYPSRSDEVAHFDWARRAFEDARYQCVDGKPVFTVFNPHALPDAGRFLDHWRELADKAGYPGMFFVGMANRFAKGVNRYHNVAVDPFDAITPHGPHDYIDDWPSSRARRLQSRLARRAFGATFNRLTGSRLRLPARYKYADMVETAFSDLPDDRRFLPAVMPGWDNTPRSGVNGVVFEGANPQLFERYLRKAVARVSGKPPQERIIFLKAWNEWAEGNYVEPDAHNGHAYLHAIRRVIFPSDVVAAPARALETAA